MLQNTATTTAAVTTTNLASSGFQTIGSYLAPIISDTTTVPCTLSVNEQTSGFPRASYETPLVRDQRSLNPYAPLFSAASMNTPDEHRIGYQSKVRLSYGLESVYQHMYPSAEASVILGTLWVETMKKQKTWGHKVRKPCLIQLLDQD